MLALILKLPLMSGALVLNSQPWTGTDLPPGANSFAYVTALLFGLNDDENENDDKKVCPIIRAYLPFRSPLKALFVMGPSRAASFFISVLGQGHIQPGAKVLVSLQCQRADVGEGTPGDRIACAVPAPCAAAASSLTRLPAHPSSGGRLAAA